MSQIRTKGNNSSKIVLKFYIQFEYIVYIVIYTYIYIIIINNKCKQVFYNSVWVIHVLLWWYMSILTLWVRITLRRGVLDTTLCDQVCQWLATGLWFSPGTLVSSTNKTDRHNITESGVKPNQTNMKYILTTL